MIVVVSAHDEKYEPLAELTLYNNKLNYCVKHGYKLHYSKDCGAKAGGKPVVAQLPPIPETHIPAGWGKIFVMKEAMEKYPDAEWIFNTDCDVMITNMNIKIEDILKEHAPDNIHILIPADCNGINCGNMIIRNSPIGKAFLDTIIAGMPLYRHWYMFENQLIQDLFIGTHLEESGVTPGGTFWARVGKVLPQRIMNSYDYINLPRLKNIKEYKDILGTDGQWQKGDFLIQWPSTDLEYRINAAKEIYKDIVM
jgi:hypothetical protein|tara:strand:- start:40 stop:798 length:759 start_codon:yes stop_codon:yes gene_type:complete